MFSRAIEREPVGWSKKLTTQWHVRAIRPVYDRILRKLHDQWVPS